MIDYGVFEYNGFQITDYTSVDYTEIREYLAGLPRDWFFTKKISEGAKIERVCKDIYGSDKYVNLVLFINGLEAIFGLPVLYDVIDERVTRSLEVYYQRFTGNPNFTESFSYQRMKDRLQEELTQENLKSSYLTMVLPTKVYAVQARIDQIVQTQKQMYSLVELEHD